jgi:hypothetical protein
LASVPGSSAIAAASFSPEQSYFSDRLTPQGRIGRRPFRGVDNRARFNKSNQLEKSATRLARL